MGTLVARPQPTPVESTVAKKSVMKNLAQITGFLLIFAGSLTLLTLGILLFYGQNSSQQFALIALTSCLCWFLAYSIYQTIRLTGSKQEKDDERNVLHWTFTPRNLSMVMTIVTGLMFSVSTLLWFNLTLL